MVYNVHSLQSFQGARFRFGMNRRSKTPPTELFQTLLDSFRIICHRCQNRLFLRTETICSIGGAFPHMLHTATGVD